MTAVKRVLAAAVLLAGCSGGQGTDAQLRGDTAAVVAAVNAHEAARARRALARLDSDAAAAGASGRVPADRVAALRTSVQRVLRDLQPPAPAPTPTPTSRPTTSSPSPAPAGDSKGDGKVHDGKGKKH